MAGKPFISTKMSAKNITILVAVLAWGVKAQADGLYDITFSDAGDVNVGSGQIDVVAGYAVGGYFDVTIGAALGAYTLYTGGGTSGTWTSLLTSPQGAFYYDNAAYIPTSTNPQYSSDPTAYIDNGGLLFTDVSGDEINLWANGDGTFSFYGDIGGNKYNPAVIGSSTINPVPEPSTTLFSFLLSGALGAFWLTRLFKSP